MKCKFVSIVLFSLFAEINAQTTEIVNPSGKWFFGAEIGLNNISSYELNKPSNSFQGGLLSEYYFARHWSVSTKLKYFKTGVAFNQVWSKKSGDFKGKVIAIPIHIKWEFRIYKNIGGSLKAGLAYNKEIESVYLNYTGSSEVYKNEYFGSVMGAGINYFITNKSAIYIEIESWQGTQKGKIDTSGPLISFYNSSNDGIVYTHNTLLSIGYKYHFSKK